MKYIARSQVTQHLNGTSCVVDEYGAGAQLDVATATINGRYPENGFVVNERSEEAAYVLLGTGSLVTKNTSAQLQSGDVAIIPANEPYYFEGSELKLVIVCTPPWVPEQHKEMS